LLRDPVADELGDIRRAAESSADMDFEAGLARGVGFQAYADIVEQYGGAVRRGSRQRDLELPRQVREFRMERRPLADDLRPRPRVLEFVRRRAGKMVGGDVADAVAGRLDGMHLDIVEKVERVRDVRQRNPVELDVLPRREVAVALVVS